MIYCAVGLEHEFRNIVFNLGKIFGIFLPRLGIALRYQSGAANPVVTRLAISYDGTVVGSNDVSGGVRRGG